MKQIIFILILIIIKNSLFCLEPIKLNNKNLNGKYIGKYIEYINERELFKEIKDQWHVDPKFINKMFIGIMKNIDISDTNLGYRTRFKPRNKNEYEYIAWGINDIIKNEDKLKFTGSDKNVFFLNFIPHAYWLRFKILNDTNSSVEIFLEQDKHFFGWFDIFIPEGNNYIEKKSKFEEPLNKKEVKYKNAVHKIKVNPGLNTYYIRIDSHLIDIVPIRIWTPDAFYINMTKDSLFHGIIIGIYILIFCYSIFISIKNKSYILLTLMIIISFLTSKSYSGFGYQYIWPFNPLIGLYIFFISFPAFHITFLLFGRNFIEIPKYTPVIDIILKIIIVLSVLILLTLMIFPLHVIEFILILVLIIEHTFYIPVTVSSVYVIKKRNKQGIFLLIGTILYFVSLVEFVLSSNNIIPYKFINYLNIRIIIFIVLMTLGAAYKIKLMNKMVQDLKEKLFEINLKLKNKKSITDESILKTETVKEFIKRNYSTIISRDNLAYAVGWSPDHLGRIFKQITGEKISDYINKIRINEVKKKLKNTNDKIIDIAFDTGFENLRTFNKVFLNLAGMSPMNFRIQYYNKKYND